MQMFLFAFFFFSFSFFSQYDLRKNDFKRFMEKSSIVGAKALSSFCNDCLQEQAARLDCFFAKVVRQGVSQVVKFCCSQVLK
jgi:hypothetical protein